MTNKAKKGKNLKIWIVSGVLFGIIFAFLIFLVLGIYRFNWNNRFFVAATKNIPFPALYVKGAGTISVNEIKSDKAAIKKFYESQDFEKIGMRVDFSTEQGKKRLMIKEKDIINKLVENLIIESLAKKRGIVLTDNVVKDELENNLRQYGNKENLMSDLARLYGWTLNDFEQKVVKPEMYSEKLAELYSNSLEVTAEKTKIESLYERVSKKREDFANIAKESSDGQSAKDGGDLGWSTKEQLIREVSEKAFSMKVGEISEPIESLLGFHILKLQEKKKDNDEEMVRLSQIFVKKPTYGDWLKDQMKKYSVTVFIKDYKWDSSTAQIEFSDQAMRTFERNLPANSEGDPSVF